jgi:hypothetical protein
MLFEAYVTCTTNELGVLHSGITFKEGWGIVEEKTEISRIAFAQTGPNITDTGSETIT